MQSPSRKLFSPTTASDKKTQHQHQHRNLWIRLRRGATLVFLLLATKVVLLDLSDFSSSANPMVRRSGVLVDKKTQETPNNSSSDNHREPEEEEQQHDHQQHDHHHRPTLHLVGERHSGTKWIYQHLSDCFQSQASVRNGLTRWKHWFQQDGDYSTFQDNNGDNSDGYDATDSDNEHPRTRVVVAQFRHPLHWVEAMRFNPYHSVYHFNLEWNDFVSKEWTMPRHGKDLAFVGRTNSTSGTTRTRSTISTGPANKMAAATVLVCNHQYNFRPHQVIPCLELEPDIVESSRRKVHTLYEMRNDGSGQPYDSILELRAAKIQNFLAIEHFTGISDFFPVQYEAMARNGTASLIGDLERALGVKAQCPPTEPQEPSSRPLSPKYIEWMSKHVDWETEALIGYEATVY